MGVEVRNPASVVSSGVGLAWVSPDLAALEDGVFAQAIYGPGSSDEVSSRLLATQFGFTIPNGARPDGFLARVKRKESGPAIRDAELYLVRSGVVIGVNKANIVDEWPTVLGFASYGGPEDLWLSEWISSQVNDPASGLLLSVRNTNGGETAFVDELELTIFYTGGAPAELTGRIGQASAEGGLVGNVQMTGALRRPTHEGLVAPVELVGGIVPATHEGRLIRRA